MDPIRERRIRRIALAIAVAATLGALSLAIAYMDPLPPRIVVMATGPDDSA
jgi:uncharacterized membrane protein